MIKKIRKAIDSANINFLIGSGLSRPFLEVLGEIETFLSDDTKTAAEKTEKKKEYFKNVIAGNLKLLDGKIDSNKDETLRNYKAFYKILNNILLKRESSILTKQVNVFTTNIDILSEMALEETGIDFNDGFHGRFNPIFNLGNFKKSYFQKSLHYENTCEIPVFNIVKLHGSLNWKYDKAKDRIFLDEKLAIVRQVEASLETGDFDKEYNNLMIVNPTKEKFADTLIKQYYYDLLRIYSNELEKENSILFVLGFSFADEHVRELTERVAGSNPTLKVYILAHSASTTIYDSMSENAKNRNIEILLPTTGKVYDFNTINAEVFEKVVPYLDAEVGNPEEAETESSA